MYCAVAPSVLIADTDLRTRGLLATWLQRVGFDPAPAKASTLRSLRQVSGGLRAEMTRGRAEMLRLAATVEPGTAESMLMTLLAMRSSDTYQHSLRVGRNSASLARALALPLNQVAVIGRAALLHDIGKAAVPPRILAFRGRPSDEEVLALQLHVTVGEEVLAAVPDLAAAAPVVGATHERFDGAGYPNRLSGTDIPLGARIISVADVYDAMTSIRPYRRPLTHLEANRELARVAGTQLDPDVVHAWIRMTEILPC
jgi:putative nucleotidyltransferase with HDIG domain